MDLTRFQLAFLLIAVLYYSEASQNQTECRTVTSQFCYWSDTCLLDCMSGTSKEINRVVYERWMERPQCHYYGLSLILGSSIQYTVDWTIPTGWFTSDVKVVELVVDCRNTVSIEDGAFDTTAFKTVEKLTIKSAWSDNMITAGSLYGLSQLKILRLTGNSMVKIQRGSLDVVAGTLEELTFQESSTYNSKIYISSLTGGNPLRHLASVKIQRNMNDTIMNDTFVALVNIISLDISYCQIEFIAAGAFTPISRTLEVLYLANNKLAQVSAGLFDGLVRNPDIQIFLDNNRWQCDCDLCYLKWLIRHGKLFNLVCRLPLQFRGDLVGDTDFCANPTCNEYYIEEDTPISNTTVYPTTTEIIPNVDNEDQLFQQQCSGQPISDADPTPPTNDFVMLPKSKYQFKFLQTSNASLAVVVESRICNMFLLWFDSTREVFRTPTLSESQAYGCTHLANTLNRTVNFQQVIVINTLQTNVPYVFCLMERTRSTVSPLNCMPYMNVVAPGSIVLEDNEVWLFGSDQTKQIVFVVAIMFGSVMVGFLVAYLLLRRQTKQLEAGAMMGYRNHSSSLDGVTESSDCGKPIDGKLNEVRRGSNCSIGSSQSYALAVNLSRFEIVQMQLQKKTTENQYYLENHPYIVAPAPPVNGPAITADENIYADIVADEKHI